MNLGFGYRTWWVLATVAGVTLGACSRASSSSGAANSGGGSSGSAAGASSINACSLLNQSEIQQQLGVAVDNGKLQTTDTQATCDWSGPEGSGVGLTVNVQDFDKDLWNSFTSSSRATAVSGLGQAAFAGVPLSGGLMIRQGKYEIDVGVVDFHMSNDREVAAAKALAALVLPRVANASQS